MNYLYIFYSFLISFSFFFFSCSSFSISNVFSSKKSAKASTGSSGLSVATCRIPKDNKGKTFSAKYLLRTSLFFSNNLNLLSASISILDFISGSEFLLLFSSIILSLFPSCCCSSFSLFSSIFSSLIFLLLLSSLIFCS